MIPLGPARLESVMNAAPDSPRRRSKRMSFRYVVSSATSAGEPDRLDHLIGFEIDADELRSARDDGTELGRPRVQQPQSARGIDDDALYRNQAIRRALVIEAVELGVGIGDLLAVAQLGDRELDRVAPAGGNRRRSARRR